MTVSEYRFREYRTRTVMISQVPIFRDSATTQTPHYQHHISMYGITEVEANRQVALGNTKFRPVKHYSSELIIDCDDVESAKSTWQKLCDLDFNFEVWKLNNYKFFLQRNESDEPREDMCFQDKQFVRDNLFIPKLDLGIYSSPFHLIRAKGAVHEVTKAKSHLVAVHKGSNTVSTNHITNFYKPTKNYEFDPNLSDWQQLQHFIEYATGFGANNHEIIWKFAKDLAKMCSYDTALELCLIYAKSLNYKEDKATRAVDQAFKINQYYKESA